MKKPKKTKVVDEPTLRARFAAIRAACVSDFNSFADDLLSQATVRIKSALVKPELDVLVFNGEITLQNFSPKLPNTILLERAKSIIKRLRSGQPVGYYGWGGNVRPGPNWDDYKLAPDTWGIKGRWL